MKNIFMPFLGVLDPKTQKATAFYALLGVLCGDIWHRGLHKWNLIALILFSGIGTLGAVAKMLASAHPPASPPEDEKT